MSGRAQADGSAVIVLDAVGPHLELREAPVRTHQVPVVTARRRAPDLYRRLALHLAATDAVCIVVGLLVSYALRFGSNELTMAYIIAVYASPIVWVSVFRGFGLYAPQHLAAHDEFRRVIGAVSVGIVFLMVASFWLESELSRSWVALTWVTTLVLELSARRLWRAYQGRLKASGDLAFRTLIVGTSDEAGELSKALDTRGSGFAPLGFVSTNGHAESPNGLPVLGSLQHIRSVIRDHSADCLFVDTTGVSPAATLQVAQAARHEGIEVRMSANVPQILSLRLAIQPVGKAMAISLKPVQLSGVQSAMKRGFDLVVATGSLLVFAPLIGIIALVIAMTSKGPVFFHQRRVTLGGRVFQMHKFRTMVKEADQILAEIDDDPSRPFFKLKDDPRLTTVGRVLRRWSLDELPQLVNVIKGEMSLVGPRPLPAEQVAANVELLGPRHEVRAGVTGWWQIHGRSEIDHREALQMDLFYIENWSLSLDLYVMMKTVGALLGRRGAH